MNIPTRLLKARRNAGFITQLEFEKASGISRSLISKLECGTRQPSVDTLRAYHKTCDVSSFELLGF